MITLSEAYRRLDNKNIYSITERRAINESSSFDPDEIVLRGFGKYFQISDYQPSEYEYQIGDLVDGEEILAYVEPKPQYKDKLAPYYYVVRSNGIYYVVSIIQGHLNYLSIHELDSYLGESKKMTSSVCSRHLNEADYVTLGNIKLPTNMTGMDDNTSYQDAAKIGQRLYDKEQVRLARVKAEQEGASLYAECEDALKSSPDNVEDKLSALFDILVPPSGESDTVAGEIIRAAMRIMYRWFNDGDVFFSGYGFETAGPSAQYLMDTVPTVNTDLLNIADHYPDYPHYEDDLNSVIDKTIDYVMNNRKLFGTRNTIDSVSVPVTDFEEATFSYDVDVSGEDFDMLMDAGIIGWNDVRDFLDDTIRYNSVFDGAEVNQWAADAFTIDNLTKDGLDELEDNMDRWLADWCQELINENEELLNGDDEDDYDDDYEDEDDLDENLNRHSRKRRITEAEDKKYALGTLVAKHMKEINSITNKNELIDFVSGLKNQVSDQTYLTREVIPNLQRKNFVAGLQYIINIALKGEKKGSIEKEFSRKSTKRNSRKKKVNESDNTMTEDINEEDFIRLVKNIGNRCIANGWGRDLIRLNIYLHKYPKMIQLLKDERVDVSDITEDELDTLGDHVFSYVMKNRTHDDIVNPAKISSMTANDITQLFNDLGLLERAIEMTNDFDGEYNVDNPEDFYDSAARIFEDSLRDWLFDAGYNMDEFNHQALVKAIDLALSNVYDMIEEVEF